jgi:hypothetical protein
LVAVLSGIGGADQRATAGRLMRGSSLIWLMVSSVMYLARCIAHYRFVRAGKSFKNMIVADCLASCRYC